ncbi:MAG: sensor histidine kinase [Lachnospiraceae bacterium]|nr:sensor histidine kinase [Lachnospiraceae bacterium]
MNRHTSLKKVYYVSFFAMVVIPILLVFFISLSVIRVMMQKSAVSAIQSSQNAVVSSLSERVRDASLQLSHFVYANGGRAMELAAMTDTEDTKQRYEYTSQLDQLFQVAMAPKQTVLSGMIYMKDGRHTYLKQELILPKEQVEQSDWYQAALKNPNRVFVGSYDTSAVKLVMTGGKSRELVVPVAIAPDVSMDRSGRIEMIVLLFRTKTGDYLKSGDGSLADTVLFDSDGNVIFDAGVGGKAGAFLEEMDIRESGVYRMRYPDGPGTGKTGYTCVVSEVPETDWRIASCVKTASLTSGFNRAAGLMLAVSSGLFLLYFAFSRFFLRNIIGPVHTMVEGLKQVEEGNLETHIDPAGQYEIRTMIHSFNRMVRQLKTSVQENEAAQEKKLQAEVRALQSQINPHFLVNTLNSIRFMAQVSKFDGIRRMAEALIKIVSCSFRSNSSFYPVKEELDILDSYLYLMKIRYSDGFDVSYQVAEDCRELLMPRLVLQPIVENSIVHGFADMDEEMGHLDIRVRKEGEKLCLEVEDNGCGMTEEEINHILTPKERRADDNYSIGIENVFSRLKLHFKEQCELEMESEPGKYTRTRIRIPAVYQEKETGRGGQER